VWSLYAGVTVCKYQNLEFVDFPLLIRNFYKILLSTLDKNNIFTTIKCSLNIRGLKYVVFGWNVSSYFNVLPCHKKDEYYLQIFFSQESFCFATIVVVVLELVVAYEVEQHLKYYSEKLLKKTKGRHKLCLTQHHTLNQWFST